MYKPSNYFVVIYFPTYLPIYETYFLHNWLPRCNHINSIEVHLIPIFNKNSLLCKEKQCVEIERRVRASKKGPKMGLGFRVWPFNVYMHCPHPLRHSRVCNNLGTWHFILWNDLVQGRPINFPPHRLISFLFIKNIYLFIFKISLLLM